MQKSLEKRKKLVPLQSQTKARGSDISCEAGFFSAEDKERSLTRLIGKYKQVPRNNKIESVNSFKELGCQGRAKQYKKYTKKSLILAQDER